jgi:hypothetical protein
VEGSAHIVDKEGLKLAFGVELTVTSIVEIGEVQAGVPAFTNCSVTVLTPVVFHDKEWGPCPTGVPPAHPSQFQVKVGLIPVPFHVAKVVAFATEGFWQMLPLSKENGLVGVGFTVTTTV